MFFSSTAHRYGSTSKFSALIFHLYPRFITAKRTPPKSNESVVEISVNHVRKRNTCSLKEEEEERHKKCVTCRSKIQNISRWSHITVTKWNAAGALISWTQCGLMRTSHCEARGGIVVSDRATQSAMNACVRRFEWGGNENIFQLCIRYGRFVYSNTPLFRPARTKQGKMVIERATQHEEKERMKEKKRNLNAKRRTKCRTRMTMIENVHRSSSNGISSSCNGDSNENDTLLR